MAAEEERVEVIDIDLNEEPNESSWMNDVANVYSRIEDRIRRLEDVTMRARRRHERRLTVEIVNEEALSLNVEVGLPEVNDSLSLTLNPPLVGRLDNLKRSDNQLLALALETNGDMGDAQVRKNSGEAFFDCNICFAKARDPILTCCGHLYCWPCFYLLPDVGPDTKECPACQGDVNDTGIIPIYGSSGKPLKMTAGKFGVTIPPRPRANRTESLRGQRMTRGSLTTRIEDVYRSLQTFSAISVSTALNYAERLAEDLDEDSNSDFLVDVPPEALVPNANADTATGLPSSTPITGNEVTLGRNVMLANAGVLLPRRISPRTQIHSDETFSNLTAPRSRGSHRGRRTVEPTQNMLFGITEEQGQRLSSLMSIAEQRARLLQQLSRVFHSEENPPVAQMFIDDPELLPVRVVAAHSSNADNNHETVSAIPESNSTAVPSYARRRNYISDTPEASASGTPEPRRRRRLG